MSDEEDLDGVYKVWRVPFGTVSWTAEDCFRLLRLETCAPGTLNDFLLRNEAAIKEKTITAVADFLQQAWYEYCDQRGLDRWHTGMTQPTGDSP
jgi:hypothetical protein